MQTPHPAPVSPRPPTAAASREPRPEPAASAGPDASEPPAGAGDRRSRPTWAAALFFFVRPPSGTTAREWSLLGVLGVTFLLNGYDMALLGLALPQIQAELGVGEAQLGGLLGVIRLGVLPAFALAFLADHRGRRTLLLVSVLGFAACTTATAFAPDAHTFAIFQFAARAFIGAEEMVAIVLLAEELGAARRGFGIGVLSAFGALGHGVASVGFAFVDVLPFGWRALYLLGALPLVLVAWVRRGLRETPRFESERRRREQAGTAGWRAVGAPLRDLVRLYPGRMLALLATVVPFAFFAGAAMSFVSKTLQDVHGWTPPGITALFLTAGVLVFAANVTAGSLADRLGRRRVLAGAVLLHALGAFVFYRASGATLVAGWVAMTAGVVGADVLLSALGSELFPTSYRSTASGVRGFVSTLASALGLWSEGWLFDAAGSHGAALVRLLPLVLLAPLAARLLLPETATRELEEIAPAAPAPAEGGGGLQVGPAARR